MKNWKFLTTSFIACCAIQTNISHASIDANIYAKVHAGNTFNNQTYSSVTPWVSGGVLFALTDTSHTSTYNLFTPGVSLGFSAPINNIFSAGLELEGSKQLSKSETTDFISADNSSPVGGILAQIDTTNYYHLKLMAVLNLRESFYVKAGPSVLRQKITTNVGDPANISTVRYKFKKAKEFYGATGGIGFNYKICDSLSLFSEYNYSYYKSRKLSDLVFPNPQLETPNAGNGDDSYYQDRKFQFSQSAIFAGIKIVIV